MHSLSIYIQLVCDQIVDANVVAEYQNMAAFILTFTVMYSAFFISLFYMLLYLMCAARLNRFQAYTWEIAEVMREQP